MSANNKGQNVANAPLLRFPEFKDEWNIVKVSDLLEFYSTNSYSWDQLDFEAGEIFNLHYGMIHNGLPTMMNAKENILPFVKEKPKNYTICKEGDVAFADASEDTNDVAKCIEFTNCDRKQIICGLHTIHGRDKLGITELGYKGYAFSSKAFHDQVKKLAQGTKIYSISAKTFSECFVGIPSNKEQQKIAKLLSLIDKRIEIQRSAIEKLKSLKSAIREKQFKQIIKKVDLNYKVSDVLRYEQPIKYIVSDTEYSDDKSLTPVLTANQAFILGYTDEKTGVYSKGHCIIIDDFTLDCKYVDFAFKVKSSAIKILTANDDNLLRYLYEYLKFLNLSSSEHKRHYISEIEPMKICLPDEDTILKVASLMKSIDKKIESENCSLNNLINQKKYLLSKMFI